MAVLAKPAIMVLASVIARSRCLIPRFISSSPE
jgi:hypothetical protein